MNEIIFLRSDSYEEYCFKNWYGFGIEKVTHYGSINLHFLGHSHGIPLASQNIVLFTTQMPSFPFLHFLHVWPFFGPFNFSVLIRKRKKQQFVKNSFLFNEKDFIIWQSQFLCLPEAVNLAAGNLNNKWQGCVVFT